MIDFIDKTSEQDGTPLNRYTMMNMQGFVACSLVPDAGKLKIVYNDGSMTTIESDLTAQTVTETYYGLNKTISQTINISSQYISASLGGI